MNAERLLQQFDRISEAPDAIPRLHRFIQDLAVRGKLVEQDRGDEPASELLKRIFVWREEAIRRKQIREPKKLLDKIGHDEVPYVLPSGWVWVRLGEAIYIQSGDGLTAANMKNGDVPVFGGNGINGYHDVHNVEEPTIVIGRVGDYCGSIHVTPDKAWVTDNAFATRFCQQAISMKFLVLLLNGTNLKENENATAQPVISGSKIYPIVVGLPPLTEQLRIVAKIDKLMALCDQLEAAKTEREQSRDRLVAASLHRLNPPVDAEEANTPEALRDHARFIFNHLPRLTTRPAHIKQLRQTILNLAVRGQLVPQDPNDEPAAQLLKRI
jgi:type I restriction enzyme S subunit